MFVIVTLFLKKCYSFFKITKKSHKKCFYPFTNHIFYYKINNYVSL